MNINENLIGLWRCNKGTGLTAFDGTIYGNDGALEGGNPTWVDGKSGKAVNLPGANERIDCGNGAPLDQIGNGSFWLSFWMKSKDTVPLYYCSLVNKYEDGNNRFMLYSYLTSNRFGFHLKKSGIEASDKFSAATQPFDTIWNHIVLVINRITDRAIVYMNTVKDTTEINISAVAQDASNTGNLSFGGRNDGNNPYEGALDELRAYTGLPTQEKIDFLHDYPSGISIPARMHHLRQQGIS